MRMNLIQPFIGSLDAVLAEMIQSPAKIADLSMQEQPYTQQGVAAMVQFKGQIEGRIILDMEPKAAARVASLLNNGEADSTEPLIAETVCELANMVIGNAVTQLNDRGFHFKVFPPAVFTKEDALPLGADGEATIMRFETEAGDVYLNILMQYHARRARETEPALS